MLTHFIHRSTCKDVSGAAARAVPGAGHSKCLRARAVQRRACGSCIRNPVAVPGSPGVLGHAAVREACFQKPEAGNEGEILVLLNNARTHLIYIASS